MAILVLAGCSPASRPSTGATPGGQSRAAGATPSTAVTTPGGPTRPNRTPTPPGTPTFSETTARPCSGFPTGDQLIALLRTRGLLATNATATIQQGPLCSGSWQYTVVVVPEQDPLVVITKGPPSALQIVAAGTDVCTTTVRTTAPAGIRLAARCPTGA